MKMLMTMLIIRLLVTMTLMLEIRKRVLMAMNSVNKVMTMAITVMMMMCR